MFKAHPWPGNIRQMVSVIQIAAAMAEGGRIGVEHLPDDFLADLKRNNEWVDNKEPTVREQVATQPSVIKPPAVNWLDVYEANGRNVSATAKSLNISRNTLYKRLREEGLR